MSVWTLVPTVIDEKHTTEQLFHWPESLHKWGVASSPTCKLSKYNNTTTIFIPRCIIQCRLTFSFGVLTLLVGWWGNPACKNTECWYSGGGDLTGTLHVQFQLASSSSSLHRWHSTASHAALISSNGLIFWYQHTWTSDQQVASSNPGLSAIECNPGQVVSTHVPLSPSSIIWYQPMGGDALRLGR